MVLLELWSLCSSPLLYDTNTVYYNEFLNEILVDRTLCSNTKLFFRSLWVAHWVRDFLLRGLSDNVCWAQWIYAGTAGGGSRFLRCFLSLVVLWWGCGSERVSVTPEVWGIRPVGEGSLIFISNAESCLYHCSVSKQKDKRWLKWKVRAVFF